MRGRESKGMSVSLFLCLETVEIRDQDFVTKYLISPMKIFVCELQTSSLLVNSKKQQQQKKQK